MTSTDKYRLCSDSDGSFGPSPSTELDRKKERERECEKERKEKVKTSHSESHDLLLSQTTLRTVLPTRILDEERTEKGLRTLRKGRKDGREGVFVSLKGSNSIEDYTSNGSMQPSSNSYVLYELRQVR